ncbi:MAG: hypothetical protein H7A46_13585 [Verrucomicrobiales bacterium]|nr:hypothetical protein [Verrucomicrobiales bacterium]
MRMSDQCQVYKATASRKEPTGRAGRRAGPGGGEEEAWKRSGNAAARARETVLPSGDGLDLGRRLIQGVDYHLRQTRDGGDLFLTRFGLPFAGQLHPENWLDSPWFETHRRRLRGTSAIYRTQTKPVEGRALDLVVRFSRVGEDVPVDTVTRGQQPDAEFNSPFEEVAALMALRAARFGPGRRRIPTKRPLAIYAPPTRMQLWQTGRSESRMAAKQARLPEIALDIRRTYVLVYAWIRGMDAEDAVEHIALPREGHEKFHGEIVAEVEADLAQAGFRMLDLKPAHILVRFNPDGGLVRHRDGRLVYALIDYELLERTKGGGPGLVVAT